MGINESTIFIASKDAFECFIRPGKICLGFPDELTQIFHFLALG
jgi:hypothetical protein